MAERDNCRIIKNQMNSWGESGIPFLFIIDFEFKKPVLLRLDEVDSNKILYSLNGFSNHEAEEISGMVLKLVKNPEKYDDYLVKFNKVKKHISSGNSYLVNLTCITPVEINITLKEIFFLSRAKYRLWLGDQFVCFSPEIFVKIENGVIRSFPMKGTIDASMPGAERIILEDKKETAEHYTIVDLIRNDLNTVSKNVRVERFRYIDIIDAKDKKLLQVSSEICGDLEKDYPSRIGDIIFALLPAGSVSGAPKKKTVEIIAGAENTDRGYYTGIFGIFDGCTLDSGVMIRYIEKNGNSYFYRSGGGITSFSNPESEYREMTDKIYVPIA